MYIMYVDIAELKISPVEGYHQTLRKMTSLRDLQPDLSVV